MTGSGSAEGGIGVAGAGGNLSVGAGVFGNGLSGVNVGAFVSGGAFAGGPGYGVGYLGAQPDGSTAAVGGYAGGGVGAFFTNATSAQGLSGPFNTYSYNLGIGPIGFSIQFGISGGTFILSVTGGPGAGYSVTTYPTTTVATGAKCGN